MKTNKIYKSELKMVAKVAKVVDKIPSGILYTIVGVLTFIAVLSA